MVKGNPEYMCVVFLPLLVPACQAGGSHSICTSAQPQPWLVAGHRGLQASFAAPFFLLLSYPSEPDTHRPSGTFFGISFPRIIYSANRQPLTFKDMPAIHFRSAILLYKSTNIRELYTFFLRLALSHTLIGF